MGKKATLWRSGSTEGRADPRGTDCGWAHGGPLRLPVCQHAARLVFPEPKILPRLPLFITLSLFVGENEFWLFPFSMVSYIYSLGSKTSFLQPGVLTNFSGLDEYLKVVVLWEQKYVLIIFLSYLNLFRKLVVPSCNCCSFFYEIFFLCHLLVWCLILMADVSYSCLLLANVSYSWLKSHSAGQ